MQISIREQGEITILDLVGEIRLDDESGDSLQDAVRSQVEGGKQKLLLNFKDLDFIDSSGVCEIVSSHVAVKERGAQMKITQVPEKIMLILKYTSLTNIIEIFTDEESALQSFI
jgi:anti-sigma B factor antagonist